jgi:hypothetical protein
MIMITNPDQVIDLEEEVREYQEAIDNLQFMTNKKLTFADKEGEVDVLQEKKLNHMISNRSECFDLLFDLLNLGVPEITQASWSLLTQVPVN